jgi:hypothetical protein
MAAVELAAMKIVLLGEQATGKSSMLVALYGALLNHRAGDTRIVRTIDEVEFLSRGLQALGRRESVHRTEIDGRSRLTIELARQERLATIELADRSGELVKNMLDTRTWDPELRRQLDEAAAAMLFLRADHIESIGHDGRITNGPSADVGPPAAEATDEPVGDGAAASADARPEPPPWSPSQMPPDVRAVDLLQSVLEDRATALPLAVVISAWDLAGGIAAAPPAVWLADHVPLLQQFLRTYAGQLPHRIFGVSAQGGDFRTDTSDAAESEDPWDRAYLVGPEGTQGTLAEPIVWLIETAV